MSSTTCWQDLRDVPMNALVPAVQHTTSGTHCYYSEKSHLIELRRGFERGKNLPKTYAEVLKEGQTCPKPTIWASKQACPHATLLPVLAEARLRGNGCAGTRCAAHDRGNTAHRLKKNLTSSNYAEVLKGGKTCQKPRRNLARPRIRHGAYMSSTTCWQDFRDVPMNVLVPAVQHTTRGTHCDNSEKSHLIELRRGFEEGKNLQKTYAKVLKEGQTCPKPTIWASKQACPHATLLPVLAEARLRGNGCAGTRCAAHDRGNTTHRLKKISPH